TSCCPNARCTSFAIRSGRSGIRFTAFRDATSPISGRTSSTRRTGTSNSGLDGQVFDLFALIDELVDDHALLLLVQRAIVAGEVHQLAVRAALDDASLVEHEDLIGVANRGEAMRDDERGAPAHQGMEAVLDQRLAFAVER